LNSPKTHKMQTHERRNSPKTPKMTKLSQFA
jgi:hypothetical protein